MPTTPRTPAAATAPAADATRAFRPLDARMRCVLRTVAATGTVGSVIAALAVGLPFALSVAIGTGIATLNLWGLARILAALLPDDARTARAQSRSPAGWALVALLKMVALVAVVWLLVRHGLVSALPMMVGFGALPIGIAIGSLVSDRPPSQKD